MSVLFLARDGARQIAREGREGGREWGRRWSACGDVLSSQNSLLALQAPGSASPPSRLRVLSLVPAPHTHTPFTLHQMPRCVCVCVCVCMFCFHVFLCVYQSRWTLKQLPQKPRHCARTRERERARERDREFTVSGHCRVHTQHWRIACKLPADVGSCALREQPLFRFYRDLLQWLFQTTGMPQ